MNIVENVIKSLTWIMAVLVVALAAGCSGGGNSIVDGGGNSVPVPVPMVTTVTPLPNALGVPINTKLITAAFTKAMDPATLTPTGFTLACPAGTLVTGAAITYLVTGNVAALTLPAADLPANTLCTATVTSATKDVAGIPLASSFSWTFTTETASDTTPPTVTGTIQANGATNVPINTKVGATFSEWMDPLTITTTTFTLTNGAMVVPGSVTYTGVSAVFTPANNLLANTVYTATITTGTRSAEGNALASDYVWSWTTAASTDTIAPTVTHTIQANGATGVAINSKVGATFSEGMDPLTITNATFTVKETATGTAVAGIASYSGVSAVFVPLNNLAANTRYTVTIKSGVGGVKDLAGNPLVRDFIISWTTAASADTTAPTVTSTIHANGATNVAINSKVGATFSEGMDPLTITNATFTVKETATGTAVAGIASYSGVSAVFVPLNNLAANTRYTVTIKSGAGGVKDLAGNPLASDFKISWTTAASADTTAPTVTSTIHADGATNVPINSKAGATFSKGMDPLTITNVNFTLKVTATGAAVAGTVSYSGLNVVFTIYNDYFGPAVEYFAPGTQYTATIKGGAGGVKDLAGNPLASDFVWSWTTGSTSDYVNPTVISTAPQANAVGVAINSAINATFSETMEPLTITIISFKLLDGETPVAGTVTYDMQNSIATFTPINPLAHNTTYDVLISGPTDLAGNILASSLTPIPWSFTTAAAP